MIKKETVLIDRDDLGRITTVINRIDGEQKYEIYTTQIADTDDVLDMFNGEYAKKIKKEDISIVDGKVKIKGAKEYTKCPRIERDGVCIEKNCAACFFNKN